MKTIIFDIDGTLALIDHRRKYLEGDKPDWKSFNHFDNIIQDLPNAPVIELLETIYDAHIYNIFLITGRMEALRTVTLSWLYNNISFFSEDILYENASRGLLMRKNDDNRADHIIKEEILHKLQADGHDILFTVDDRQQVVDMWRRNGITCLQVADGNF